MPLSLPFLMCLFFLCGFRSDTVGSGSSTEVGPVGAEGELRLRGTAPAQLPDGRHEPLHALQGGLHPQKPGDGKIPARRT